ncbi:MULTISPECIES: lysophospholipid acyltransferase family protein [Pigmentiphaga]|uniref:1-acyl-sn-glycerol-3-phosphate acyltransferase n=1 Tax=Pigmentiphaga daeguensis TaxID=414049 RepID=A0ABN1C4Q8_9BURK|nr:lysophospholipid acyltransferase family protein [Pigmentiphaga sp. NML030171]
MRAWFRLAAHLLRFSLRFLLVTLWVIFGLIVLATVFRRFDVARRDRINCWWSRWLLRWCGVRVYVSGHPPVEGAALLIANHVSWLDIYALSSVRCTIFVGKRELRDWPVLGWLIAGVGTVFIERGNRRALHHVAQAMGERFARGQLIGLFPEGTTSDGLDVLPFHAGLFEPARRAGVPVLPVALRYLHHGARSTLPSYVGEETLMGNAWRVLGSTGVAVQVVYLPPATAENGDEDHRHAMAARVREAIRAEVRQAD